MDNGTWLACARGLFKFGATRKQAVDRLEAALRTRRMMQ
jgi:hypothetical protein